MPFIIGPIAVKKLPSVINIRPNIARNGPAATTPSANAPNIFFCELSRLLNHVTPSLIFSTICAKTAPSFSPQLAATPSKLLNMSVSSPRIGFIWLKKPPPLPPASKKFAPTLPSAAHMFASAAVIEFSPMTFAAPPKPFSTAFRKSSDDISPFEASSVTSSALTPSCSASIWTIGIPLSSNWFISPI